MNLLKKNVETHFDKKEGETEKVVRSILKHSFQRLRSSFIIVCNIETRIFEADNQSKLEE